MNKNFKNTSVKKTEQNKINDLKGLSNEQVQTQINKGLVNNTINNGKSSQSLMKIIKTNTLTPFNAILSIGLVLVLATGRFADCMFGLIMLINSLIGIVVEYKAKLTLDKLSIITATKQTVVRNGGVKTQIPISEIVVGDLALFSNGDQIPVDCKILESNGLETNESLVTGESDDIEKSKNDNLLSGSFVTAGSCVAVVEKVGTESYAGNLHEKSKKFTLVKSELQQGINKLLKYMCFIVFPLMFLLFWNEMREFGVSLLNPFVNPDWRLAVAHSVGGMTGMIPEGLVLLTSLNFAYSAIKLAKLKVLVQQLPSIEVLARVNVLCLDKTGTITDGKIVLEHVLKSNGTNDFAGNFADEFEKAMEVLKGISKEESANQTAKALSSIRNGPAQFLDKIEFSSKRKWSAYKTQHGFYIFGAPDILLNDKQIKSSFSLKKYNVLESSRKVVLCKIVGINNLSELEKAPNYSLLPLALAVFTEQIRQDAKETLSYFQNQGVELKVISGDNPQTVKSIANAVGIASKNGFIDATKSNVSESILEDNIFGRVKPEQKLEMVQSLQKAGKVVAMTGDGVNDTLALKDADLGIAMSNATGAAKGVSKLIILGDSFASFPKVLFEGRRVMANMERSANLFLVKTAYSTIIALLVVVLGLHYPFSPRHLTLIGLWTIGIPGFLIAISNTASVYKKGFLQRILRFCIPAGFIDGIIALIVHQLLPKNSASTGATMSVIIIGLFILGKIVGSFNLKRFFLVLSMFGLSLLSIFAFGEFLEIYPMSINGWIIVFIMSFIGILLIKFYELVIDKLAKKYLKRFYKIFAKANQLFTK